MKELGMLVCFFAPLIPFPAHKFSEQMGTKGTRKFRFSAPQPIVYDACNCVTLHCYRQQTLWCIPGGHNNKGEKVGLLLVILIKMIWVSPVIW